MKKKANILSCAILTLLALLVWWLSSHVTWLNDDVYFHFKIGAEGSQYISSVSDIVQSQWAYYHLLNGRVVTHCIVQAFCSMDGGQALFAVCNALVWVAFVLLIVRLSGFSWRQPLAVLTASTLALVCFRTQFSPPCQVNYIWAMTAGMAVVDYFLHRASKRSVVTTILLVIGCFLAGWGQESFSTGIAAAMWLHLLFHWRTATRTQWAMTLAFTAGMVLLCIAPGNFRKLGEASGGGYWVTPVTMAVMLRACYLVVAVLIVLLIRRRDTLVQMWRDNAFYVNALLVMLAFNLVVRVYCNRQLFGMELMALIITLRLIKAHMPAMRWRVAGVTALSALALLVAVDDVTLVNRRTALCQRIEQLYRASSDGTVYCDIPSRDFCYDDHDAMYSYNGWTITQQRRLWLAQGDNREFHWMPLAMKSLRGKPLKSQVIEAGDGTFVLIDSKADSVNVFSTTSIRNFYGIKVHGQELTITGDGYNYGYMFDIDDPYYTALVLRDNGNIFWFTSAHLVK